MSDVRASQDGAQEESPDFSLTRVVNNVSQQGFAQTESLREKQKMLLFLQATFTEVERRREEAEQELRSKEREMLMLESDTEHLEKQNEVLNDRCASISKEIIDLQVCIRDEEENAHMALAKFNAYRNKMEDYRAAVLRVESQTEAHKQLEEKRALVRTLTQKKEALKEDLENPNGNTVNMAKREMDALKEGISVMRRTVAERRKKLEKELVIQSQINKDIEIQNRRYEAIVKRLHCQLSRAQAVHRQMSEDVCHMERQLAELRKQLES